MYHLDGEASEESQDLSGCCWKCRGEAKRAASVHVRADRGYGCGTTG